MICVDGNKRPTINELYYDSWLMGENGWARKMTLKMLNDQYANNPLAKIVNWNDAKSLLAQRKDWRPQTFSSSNEKRIDPDKHLKAVDKIRSLGFNYDIIKEKLGDYASDISRMYREFVKS